MKAMILAAGQGKRLLPETAEMPKSLLDIGGRPMIAWQIGEFAACGFDEIVVIIGFQAELARRVIGEIAEHYPQCDIRVIENAQYATSDNLVSCWTGRAEMNTDFVLVNGDTVFHASVLKKLLASPVHPVTLTNDVKAAYDEDDMKIRRNGTRLLEIGKTLPLDQVDGESIGMILFRGEGPGLFAAALEEARRNPASERQWYLSVIGTMAGSGVVETCEIAGLEWCEVDYPADLTGARALVAGWE